MSAILTAFTAALLAVLPRVVMAILMKFASEKFVQAYLEKLIVAGLQHAAKITPNTVDDELVAIVEQRLKEPSEVPNA